VTCDWQHIQNADLNPVPDKMAGELMCDRPGWLSELDGHSALASEDEGVHHRPGCLSELDGHAELASEDEGGDVPAHQPVQAPSREALSRLFDELRSSSSFLSGMSDEEELPCRNVHPSILMLYQVVSGRSTRSHARFSRAIQKAAQDMSSK
jgi:hypothetical protein